MTYVMSDLHGRYDRYCAMLEKINFSLRDTLYVLGDSIDGDNNSSTSEPVNLLKDMMNYENIVNLQGNHELWGLPFLRPLKTINFFEYGGILGYKRYPFRGWQMCFGDWLGVGGLSTLEDFAGLPQREATKIIDYIDSWGFYKNITIGKNRYILSHAGIYEYDTPLDELVLISPEEWTFNIDFDYGVRYFPEYDNIYNVMGHTPTEQINPKYRGRIYREKNHIVVDTGTIWGRDTGCLCLETDEEFYV